MNLTPENYFSPEAMWKYMSYSQYSDFAGTAGQRGCEALAMAKLRGDYVEERTDPMLIGSYVDAHFEGTLGVFKSKNPDCFKKDGGLKSEFLRSEEIIQRIERDPYFMLFMSGEKQQIFTANIFGCEWKCKIDSLDRGKYITDLKIMKSIRMGFWVKDIGKMSFVHYWGYDIQACIYQRIVEANIGKKLPVFIAAASKEVVPDIEIITFRQGDLEDSISMVENNIKRILLLKAGKIEPDRCGTCDYCKFTKILTKPIHFSELIEKV